MEQTSDPNLVSVFLEADAEEERAWLAQLRRQDRESKDAKDFGPYWLEGIQGSLAEERRKSKPNGEHAYNSKVKSAWRLLKKSQQPLGKFFISPDIYNIQLSELWSLYPDLTVSLQVDLTKIVRRKSSLLRNFLIYYYTHPDKFHSWIKMEIEEEIDRCLRQEDTFRISPRLLQEMKAIRKIFLVLGKDEGLFLLHQIYSEENLRRWIASIEGIFAENYLPFYIPQSHTAEKVRRRGYKESHPNKRKSKNQEGEINMSSDARTLEEIRESILKKQAILFEKRLDEFLRLEDPEIPQVVKKQMFREIVTSTKSEEQVMEEAQLKFDLLLTKGKMEVD